MSDFRNQWKGWNDLPHYREGNTGKYIKYQTYLFDLVREKKPGRILEIGFNAGHSACCFLNANPDTEMISFDICRHGTEQPAYEVLTKYFNLTLVKGDSTLTVPSYFADNSTSKFDFIFVDGGHSDDVPYLDILNTLPHLNTNGIIIVDDADQHAVRIGISKIDWDGLEPMEVPQIEKRIRVFKKTN